MHRFYAMNIHDLNLGKWCTLHTEARNQVVLYCTVNNSMAWQVLSVKNVSKQLEDN